MPLSDMVLRSKLVPPQSQKAIFHRPRLQQKFKSAIDYPLTLVHASTGFGKTTALVELSGLYNRVYWYNVTEADRDPTLFLAYLISAFLPATAPLVERLEKGGIAATANTFIALINQLTTDLEEDAVLILDDYHLVSGVTEINRWIEKIVEQRPPRLHIAIASRQIPETPGFIRWRVKGNVMIIDQEELCFSADEIQQLFNEHYCFPITTDQAQLLYAYTDGWVSALQLIWQRLQSSRSKKLENILAALPSAMTDIFSFLAQEVLMRQPESIQKFLVSTAILQHMDAKSCDYLLGINDSNEILQLLVEKGLFISTADHVIYRYQRLFQDFLLDQGEKTPARARDLHRKAADFFTQTEDYEGAVYHRFCDRDLAEAARLIEIIGPKMLETGRLGSITKWIEQLDDEQLDLHPSLRLLMGDVLRLRSNFEEAIDSYNKAENIFVQHKDHLGHSHALRSKAQVYLDTIRPLRASSLLEEAVGLLEPQEYPAEMALLLDQLAENKLNLGKPDEALELHKEANMLRSDENPNDIYLEARALLRTGRLHEGCALLESSTELNEDPSAQRPQRFHREMSLLLSLFYLMLGDIQKGERFAQRGIEIGRQLDSPFVEAVGLMRIGHAFQLSPQSPWRKNRTQKAAESYERAMQLVKPFNVVRVQVEPLWGLCRYHGYQGNLTEAKRLAAQATDIARSSGDYWLAAIVETSLGISCVLAGERDQAEQTLNQAAAGFDQVGDVFGKISAQTGLILNSWLCGETRAALDDFSELAPRIRAMDFSFLFTKPSQLGVQDPQIFLPILIEAVRQGIEPEWINGILKGQNLDDADYHPGYGLAVRALGPCEVWRGDAQIHPREWQREKARQLFQFFLAGKGKWYSREQICDRLWPSQAAGSADKNLKVAMSALNRALEPKREPGMTPFFISRRDNLYGLNPAAAISVDVDDFLVLAGSDQEADLLEALSIYQGDYLAECANEAIGNDFREQIRDVYLQTSLRLADLYFQQERQGEAIKICHDILETDACNEPAYQMLMRCHAARGNSAAVHSVYQRCKGVLADELDVEPSSETSLLWQQLTK